MTFSALIGNEIKNYDVEYKRTVEKGTIIGGQETSNIQISTEGSRSTMIKETLEIKGLTENCNSKDSGAGVRRIRIADRTA